jgi:hypothetical protein
VRRGHGEQQQRQLLAERTGSYSLAFENADGVIECGLEANVLGGGGSPESGRRPEGGQRSEMRSAGQSDRLGRLWKVLEHGSVQ